MDFHAQSGSEHLHLDSRASFKDYVAAVRGAFPDFTISAEIQIAEGDKVVTRWLASGTHKGTFMGIAPTGKQVRVTGISIDRFVDGKIAGGWHDWDALGLMKQIGVIP